MCGEKGQVLQRVCCFLGSPPHVRGKAKNCGSLWTISGITPACAGKSNFFVFWAVYPKDHPRMCGEKFTFRHLHHLQRGSPPHMRGKEHGVLRGVLRVGITPAYAGKSSSCTAGRCSGWDHPRICGEKQIYDQKNIRQRGSPPHMRGKGARNGEIIAVTGITPAYAGKSLPSLSFAHTYWDHPRICGEKDFMSLLRVISRGSPPHMRGKACFLLCRL